MWKRKRKLEAEAPEAANFYGSGSGSGKCEMNGSGSGSGSCKKILEAEAEAIKIYRFHRFHYSGFLGKIFSFFRNFFRNSTRFKANLDFNKVEAEAEAAILEAEAG